LIAQQEKKVIWSRPHP